MPRNCKCGGPYLTQRSTITMLVVRCKKCKTVRTQRKRLGKATLAILAQRTKLVCVNAATKSYEFVPVPVEESIAKGV